MTSFPSARSLALLGGASVLALLLNQPAQAHSIAHVHGLAQGGVAAGLLHPISGIDHLLLLIGVGAAAASLSASLLVWALAAAVAGGLFGAMGGSLPAQESLAALAITAVALLVVRSLDARQRPRLVACGALVSAAVAVHAMLHGLEAPADGAASLWWLGAFTASLLLSGGSFLLLRRLPLAWTRGVALLLALAGVAVALEPLALGLR